MSESRYKSGRKKGFIVLYREAAQDVRLSLEARGLFAMMVSLPDSWDYSVSGLAVKAGCGKDKIRRLLKELQAVGYLIREQSHDSGGKFSGNVYVLQDEAPPLSGNTDNGENRQRETPLSAFPTQKNKDLRVGDTKEPPIPPKGAEPEQKRKQKSEPKYRPDLFDRFWSKYPTREGERSPRAKAVSAWDKLKPSLELCFEMSKRLDPENWPKSWHRDEGRYIPQASTWLNRIREDGLPPAAASASASPPASRVVEEEGTYLL